VKSSSRYRNFAGDRKGGNADEAPTTFAIVSAGSSMRPTRQSRAARFEKLQSAPDCRLVVLKTKSGVPGRS
jgi:hypothetical protein